MVEVMSIAFSYEDILKSGANRSLKVNLYSQQLITHVTSLGN